MLHLIHFHDGVADFPHGAGPSEQGWYAYRGAVVGPEPLGPFPTPSAAISANYHYDKLCAEMEAASKS